MEKYVQPIKKIFAISVLRGQKRTHSAIVRLMPFFGQEKSHFLPEAAAKCQKSIFYKSPTCREGALSILRIQKPIIFFLLHSEAVSKIKLFSLRPGRKMKTTQKVVIKEPLLLGHIFFSYATSNQYQSTRGYLTM